MPESISLLAGDAAHNIRSALDHFAWSAVSPQQREADVLSDLEQCRSARTGEVEGAGTPSVEGCYARAHQGSREA